MVSHLSRPVYRFQKSSAMSEGSHLSPGAMTSVTVTVPIYTPLFPYSSWSARHIARRAALSMDSGRYSYMGFRESPPPVTRMEPPFLSNSSHITCFMTW